jgi:hypothetical protein
MLTVYLLIPHADIEVLDITSSANNQALCITFLDDGNILKENINWGMI